MLQVVVVILREMVIVIWWRIVIVVIVMVSDGDGHNDNLFFPYRQKRDPTQ